MFDWFRTAEPQDNAGFSILIYDVAGSAQGEWVAFCTGSGSRAARQNGRTIAWPNGPRQIYFDCRSSWVFPNDGQARLVHFAASRFPGRLPKISRIQLVYSHGASR